MGYGLLWAILGYATFKTPATTSVSFYMQLQLTGDMGRKVNKNEVNVQANCDIVQ